MAAATGNCGRPKRRTMGGVLAKTGTLSGSKDRHVLSRSSGCASAAAVATKVVGEDGQSFDVASPLAGCLNCSLAQLRDAIATVGSHRAAQVFYYVVESVHVERGDFVQRGPAPNFQGGRLTLCSCKHGMRATSTLQHADPVWVAGLTGVNEDPRGKGNWLVYLMKAKQFPSQSELWEALPGSVRDAKAAHLNNYGDVYAPERGIPLRGADRFKPTCYTRPGPDHSHRESWAKDICYPRKPAMLLGDPDYSFLWTSPDIILRGSDSGGKGVGRSFRHEATFVLSDFLDALEER
jgi:hypothetical protein